MENTELIEIIKDLLETPDHSQLLWQVEKRAIDLIDKLETKQLSIAAVSQQRELKPQVKREKATWQCDDCDKWHEPSNSCPHCGFCG